MFSIVEGHLLQRRRACRWKERGVAAEISWQFLSIWLASLPSQSIILFPTEDISFSLWGHFFFSQSNTEEQNTQGFTETLSQPMTQSVSAIVGCWVLIVRCWWLAIEVSRWLRPSLRGMGRGRGQHFSACLKLWEKIKRTSDRWCCNKWRTESCCKSFSYFLKPVPAF